MGSRPHLLVVVFVAVLGVAGALGVGIAVLTGGGSAAPQGVESPVVPVESAPVTGAPTASPATGKTVTVLTEHGNGVKTTRTFTVTGSWDLEYSYRCADDPSGVFAVSTQDASGQDQGDIVNESSGGGSDVTHQHSSGTIALAIRASCPWSLRVVQLP